VIEELALAADDPAVARAAVFVLTLLGLAVSGVKLVRVDFQPHRGGKTALIKGEELAYVELTAAVDVMAEAKALVGTYAYTDLKRFKNLRTVSATETRFCLEVVKDGSVFHVAGPGRKPGPGACSPR
jgi:hypothetical protein